MMDGQAQSGGGAPGKSMQSGDAGVLGAPGQSMKAEAGVLGAAGKSMQADAGAVGGPGQSMKGEAGAVGGPGQSMKEEAGAVGGPGQSVKGEAGGPGQPGQSVVDGGATGGPGQAAAGAPGEAGSSGGPQAAKDKKESAELSSGEPSRKNDDAAVSGGPGSSGGPGAAGGPGDGPGASGGPGSSGGPGAAEDGATGGPGSSGGPGAKGKAKDEDDDLVDPDADRPNFGSAEDGDDENADEDEDADDDTVAERGGKGAKGGKAAKKKTERKPIDPAYITVAVMGIAVLSLAGMIWLGRNALMEMWPGISGFYKSMGVAAEQPGEGLRISESAKRLQRIGGVETLVVRGFISNMADVPKAVPNLRLELYNEKKEVIQDSTTNAPVGLLDPNGSVEFEVRMELPQLSQAKGGYGVVWQQ